MPDMRPSGTSPGWDLVTLLVPPTGDPVADRDAVADLLDETVARRDRLRRDADVAHRAERVVVDLEIRHLGAAVEAYDSDDGRGGSGQVGR